MPASITGIIINTVISPTWINKADIQVKIRKMINFIQASASSFFFLISMQEIIRVIRKRKNKINIPTASIIAIIPDTLPNKVTREPGSIRYPLM